MNESSDRDLLRLYVNEVEESAFAQLVRRHGDWIYAAARRRLRDDHLAEDVAQAVFLVLAEKAGELARDEARRSLSAWLFHVMHFACVKAQRSRMRRERHERSAAAVNVQSGEKPTEAVLALLEDTIAQLPAEDREAVVRRFYRRQEFATVGAALGVSAEAARKQVTRALAKLRKMIVNDRVDVIPDTLLGAMDEEPIVASARAAQAAVDQQRASALAKGTAEMVDEAKDMGFTVMSAEFFVKDVEANLEFFEKLGFLRRWSETPDAMGRIPRASLRGGNGRIWLRRASEAEGTRPMPGVILYFWIEGGAEGLTAHRDRILARGVRVSPFFDDIGLRNFTVTTPDGYTIGFFTQYK